MLMRKPTGLERGDPDGCDGHAARSGDFRPRTAWIGQPACAALVIAMVWAFAGAAAPCAAQQLRPGVDGAPPFTATLSNNLPLAFGMDAEETARALGSPLSYVSGRPGSEILLALRPHGGSGFFNRQDRLYLQFRGGRLSGWKGDWGSNWMWK